MLKYFCIGKNVKFVVLEWCELYVNYKENKDNDIRSKLFGNSLFILGFN